MPTARINKDFIVEAKRARVFMLASKPGFVFSKDFLLICQSFSFIHSAVQDIPLRPLASFLQPSWNSWNKLPMRMWLTNEMEPSYRDRMHAMGNIVVPACGDLGFEVLCHMQSQRK